jgi:hypothetical protein
MASWVLTRGLTTWRAEINSTFPDREKYTDGSIGDSSHSGSTSGHNPDITGRAEYRDGDGKNEVRAIDVDKDLRSTVTMEQLIQFLVRLGRAGVYLPFRYFIYNGRIWRKATGWKTEVYTGANSHDQHAHFSGDYTQKADEWTGSLGLASLVEGEDDMAGITQTDFNARMDAWWLARMSPGAKDNPQRAALRVAPWQQEVGKTGVTTHNTLFGTMMTLLRAAAGDDVDEDALAAALAPAIAGLVTPALVAVVEANGGAPLTQEQVTSAVKAALREGTA